MYIYITLSLNSKNTHQIKRETHFGPTLSTIFQLIWRQTLFHFDSIDISQMAFSSNWVLKRTEEN